MAAALGALGCSGAPVRVRSYNPLAGTEQAGAVYFLPKSRIEVAFTVALAAQIDDTKCESIVSECKYHFDVPEITDVTIGTQQIPDPRAGFVIETNQTFVTETNFDGFFSPRGELTGVTASEQDHSLDFVTQGIGLITKLAGIMAMAGPTQATTIQAQFKRRRALLSLLAKSDAALGEARPCLGARPPLASGPPAPAPGTKARPADAKPPPGAKAPSAAAQANANAPPPSPPPPPCVTTDDLRRTLELRKAMLKEISDLNRELSLTKDIRVQCVFEPTRRLGNVDIRKDGGVCPAYTALKLQLGQAGFDVPLPALSVQWQSAAIADKPVIEKGGAEPGRPEPAKAEDITYAGIVYRIPEWFSVTVTRSSRGEAVSPDIASTSGDVVAITGDVVAIAGDIIALPQFGKLMTTSFDKADLRTGKELKIELHEGQGSLKRLSYRATPYDPKQIQPVVEAIPMPKATPAPVLMNETTRLQEETKRVLAEKAYIEALKELNEAKQQPPEEPPAPPRAQSGASTDPPASAPPPPR